MDKAEQSNYVKVYLGTPFEIRDYIQEYLAEHRDVAITAMTSLSSTSGTSSVLVSFKKG